MSFNYIDLIFVFIVLLNVANGIRRGFILGLMELLRWVVGFILAVLLYETLSDLLRAFTSINEIWTPPIAFVFLLVTFSLLIYTLGRYINSLIPPETHKDNFNRALGIIPGVANGLILSAVIASTLFTLPVSTDFSEFMEESYLADGLATQTDEIQAVLTPIFEDALNETLTRRLTQYPGSDEMVELPYRITDFKPRPDLEEEMLELVNEERAKVDLPPVKADGHMREVARKHSADMFRRGYFSHKTPEGKSPFDRMKDESVRFQTAGENLATAPTLKIAHTGLMNSPGHRANILQPNFGRLGIGILDGGRRGLMITQNFRN